MITPQFLNLSYSTGGIVALGLTVRDWSVDECTRNFETLCTKAFTQRKGSNVPFFGRLLRFYNHSMYRTEPLKEALTNAFPEEQYLFGGRPTNPRTYDVKVAVTAISGAGTSTVLSNYNRPPESPSQYATLSEKLALMGCSVLQFSETGQCGHGAEDLGSVCDIV